MNTPIVSVAHHGGIAIISVNNPPVNTITAAVRAGLLQAVEQVRGRSGGNAAVLLCEGSTFLSGADIGEFSGPPMEDEYRHLFAQIEQLPFPVVAGMHGTVMGGGLEITLACHYRVAAPGTRFGLPEVTLGIMPGAGGTQRMPRLIGVEKTLEMVLGAAPVNTKTALEFGFLDRVIEGDLRAGTIAFAQELVAANGDRAVPADAPIRRRRPTRSSPGSPPRRQYRNRQAPLTAIEAIRGSVGKSLDRAGSENRLANVAKATTSPRPWCTCSLPNGRRKVRTRHVTQHPVKKAAIIGSGTWGGIAICFANAGSRSRCSMRIRRARPGLGVIDQTYASMVKAGG